MTPIEDERAAMKRLRIRIERAENMKRLIDATLVIARLDCERRSVTFLSVVDEGGSHETN